MKGRKKKDVQLKEMAKRAERVQFSLQVQNSGSPKECGVDSIRPNCLQLESSQPNLISHILRDSFLCLSTVPFGRHTVVPHH